MFDILLCNLNCVILSCFASTCVLYYCDLFHIWLSCNSFDLQNVCVKCFIFCYVIWIVSFYLVLSVLVHYTTVTSFISDCPVTVLIYKMYVLILNLRTRHRWVVNFTPKGRGPGTHWIGGCVIPTVGLDILKTKISCICLDINSRLPSP
jgi:hypothetical protein